MAIDYAQTPSPWGVSTKCREELWSEIQTTGEVSRNISKYRTSKHLKKPLVTDNLLSYKLFCYLSIFFQNFSIFYVRGILFRSSPCPYNPSYPVSNFHSFREIKPRKFAKKLSRLIIICHRRLHLILKVPKVYPPALKTNLSPPFLTIPSPNHTLVLRCPLLWPLIVLVLCVCAQPKIAPAVIKPVMIYMVHTQPVRRIHNLPVHRNCASIVASVCVKRPPAPCSAPFIPAKPVVIFRIYNCEFTLRQKYEFCFVLTCFQSPQNSCTSVSSEPHSGHLTWVTKTFEPSGFSLMLRSSTQRRKVHLQLRHKA